MADVKQILAELRAENPEVYGEMVQHYQQSDWDRLEKNEVILQEFVSRYKQAVEAKKEALAAMNNAIDIDTGAPEKTGESEEFKEGEEQEKPSEQTEAMITDPYQWESFYAPAPEEQAKRFGEADRLLSSEEGKAFAQTAAWKSSNIEFGGNKAEDLNATLDLCAYRRMASSNEPITLQNLSEARSEESKRIKVEYYNSLYAMAVGNKYTEISAQKHIERVLKIDEAVRSGKSEQEIFKMLSINPNEAAQKMAYNSTLKANTKPVTEFVESKKSFRQVMHNFGKVMDTMQQIEQKNPLFGFAVNFWAAGNPVYMGYRSILSSRALYNDFQGFKDYAAFKEIHKDKISENGFKRWQEQNKDSKLSKHDYDQVKKYDSYEEYAEKHTSNRISKEDFAQLKKFHKNQEFTRAEFDMLRQAGHNYDAYAAQMKGAAVNKELFESVVKYADVRRSRDYAEYVEKHGKDAVSEQDFNKAKTLNAAMKKVSMFEALKDKTTRKAMMAHSVIFVRSVPVIGQGYALGMAVSNMTKKSYWQGLKAKSIGTGKAIQTLWSKKGRDKDAWISLYQNGGGLLAEAGGAWMLANGARNTFDHTFGTAQAADIKITDEIGGADRQPVQADSTNVRTTVLDSLNNVFGRFQGAMGYGQQEVLDSISQPPLSNDTVVRDNTAVATNDSIIREMVNDSIVKENTFSLDSLAAEPKTPETTYDFAKQFGLDQNWTNAFAADSAATEEIKVPYAPEQEPLTNDSAAVDRSVNNVAEQKVDSTAYDLNKFGVDLKWANEDFTAAHDSIAAEDVKVPYAPGYEPEAEAKTFTMNDEQKANLESLFKMYPRAATIILEGNENPSVNDITKGGFSIEGEEKLYNSGVISSAKLQELYESGKLSTEQIESLSKFADANFDNGKMSSELRSELYGTSETQRTETVHRDDARHQQSSDNDERSEARVITSSEDGRVDGYSFDKNGNIIYQMDDLKDMAGMNPDEMDAKVYQDLLNRQANGEKLDAGALKFLDNYKAAHPDLAQNSDSQDIILEESKVKVREEEVPAQTPEQQQEQDGIMLKHRDLESGGYELYGSGEMGGKQVDVSNYFDESGKLQVSQYTVYEGEGKATIVKSQMLDGKPYNIVTEIDGDKTTSREVEGTLGSVLRDVLGEDQSKTEGVRETKGLEESQKLVSDNEQENNAQNDREQEDHIRSDKVRSETFRGKYWMETDAYGRPQLHCTMSNPQSIPVDRELVHAFQNTIEGSGQNYQALGGLLRADNYGSEHREAPHRSGIMVQCEHLAQTLARNEAVYQDMQQRIAAQDPLDKLERQWLQNYEQDMQKIGLVRENGRLVYSPEYEVKDILERGNDVRSGNDEVVQTREGNDGNDDRKVYHLGEGQGNDQGATHIESKGYTGSYKITESENGYKISYESDGVVRVDQKILNAVRPNMLNPDENGNYVAANGTITSGDFNIANTRATLLAQNLTRNEAVYDHLMQEGANRELTKGEQMFMAQHEQTLDKVGLKHDTNGDVIRKNEYEGQARAAARRGRGGTETDYKVESQKKSFLHREGFFYSA